MKVLLINPASRLIQKSWAYRRFATPIVPLGLCYLAAVLENSGIEVKIVDQFANGISNNRLLKFIRKFYPDIVGIACYTPLLREVRLLSREIRAIDKRIKIVLGNAHPTYFPAETLKDSLADIVVRGEGEYAMQEVCQAITGSRSLNEIEGISFKNGSGIIHNADRELNNDLDDLPFPAWHLINLDDYREAPLVAISKARNVPILASRGCPYHCYYCSQDKVYSRPRFRKLNRVIDEIEYGYEKFNIRYFGFADAFFPYSEEAGLEFCDKFINRGLHKKVKWFAETRVDKITPGLLGRMKEAGVYLLMYGIEVGNQEVLDTLNKGTTLKQARFALRQTRKADILSLGFFMLGLPGETEKTCQDTKNFAKEIDCDIAKFNIATPYPGSRFFQECGNKEKVFSCPEKFTSWYDWLNSKDEFVFAPKAMTSTQLRLLQRKAMFEFYVRPKVIIRHIMKGTIRCENIFIGGLWLILLFCSGIVKRLKSFLLRAANH